MLVHKALTYKIPFSSKSKETSILGTPLGAGGILDRINVPSLWLSLVNYRSPSKTYINTSVWLSLYVVKVCVYFEGI